MAKFMLILKGGELNYSPEEMQKVVEKYMAWDTKMREKGMRLGGEELGPKGRVVRVDGSRVVDGPFTETKESVGGFWLIDAESLEKAVEVSRSCPHLDYKGEIEVREVIPH